MRTHIHTHTHTHIRLVGPIMSEKVITPLPSLRRLLLGTPHQAVDIEIENKREREREREREEEEEEEEKERWTAAVAKDEIHCLCYACCLHVLKCGGPC